MRSSLPQENRVRVHKLSEGAEAAGVSLSVGSPGRRRRCARARLSTMIDMRNPLTVLATRMPWGDIEAGTPGAQVDGRDLPNAQVPLLCQGTNHVMVLMPGDEFI